MGSDVNEGTQIERVLDRSDLSDEIMARGARGHKPLSLKSERTSINHWGHHEKISSDTNYQRHQPLLPLVTSFEDRTR